MKNTLLILAGILLLGGMGLVRFASAQTLVEYTLLIGDDIEINSLTSVEGGVEKAAIAIPQFTAVRSKGSQTSVVDSDGKETVVRCPAGCNIIGELLLDRDTSRYIERLRFVNRGQIIAEFTNTTGFAPGR